MSEDFIAKTPRLRPSQDFAFLRSEGLRHVEEMGHELWTDYNVHDPGITVLEALCYAITELGYRTGYDVADLMTEIDQGVEVNNADFHTAREVLTNHPVSFDDLRKLVVDVAGVRNAWIEQNMDVVYHLDREQGTLTEAVPGDEDAEEVPVRGLYDVYVEYDDSVETSRLLRLGLGESSAGADTHYILPSGKGILFDADYELILEAVSVYADASVKAEAPKTVRIALEDAAGEVLAETEAELTLPKKKNRVPLGFRVRPGVGYRLRAYPTGDGLKLYRETSPAPGYPFTLERLLSLGGGVNDQGESTGTSAGYYFFFYDWEVSFAVAPAPVTDWPADPPVAVPPPPAAPAAPSTTREDVRLAILDRLHRHRNLCEDFVNILDLEKEEIAVCAGLELRVDADVEEVLAEVFFRLEQHISPAVRFYSVDELLEKGKSVDEIFEGPPLEHGFVDEEELRGIRRRCEIRTSDVIRILMDVEEVLAVKRISLLSFVDGALRTQADWRLELATDRFRAPELSTGHSKVLFYKDELPYFADLEEVEQRLAEKRSRRLGSKLAGQDKDLPVPAGEYKDLGAYEPVQNELPAAYTVGTTRVPASASALRHAQSRQLKAYLLLFEQLLANHLAQLANVRALFSWSATSTATYFTQEVTGIADLEELYNQDLLDAEHGGSLAQALAAIAEEPGTAAARKDRFLEHLLSRFSESLVDYGRLMARLGREAWEILEDKRAFLADYPLAGGRRGAAHDYRYGDLESNVAGFARRVYRKLGFRDVRRRPLAGRRLRIEELPGPSWRFVLDDEGGNPLFTSHACDSKSAVESLLDSTLPMGGEVDNYEENGDATAWELVLVCPGKDARVLGETTSADPAVRDEVVAYFREFAHVEGFHVVEHVLLRQRGAGDPFLPVQLGNDGECPEVIDPYSFQATVVLPSWPPRLADARFRRFVEEALRREAPAHVWLKIIWISHQQMKSFEAVYDAWQEGLAAGEAGGAPLADLVEALRGLISVHPVARLHDCQESDSSSPQITLNRTNLGTS